MTVRLTAATAVCTLLLPAALAAQGWRVSVAAGRAVDDPVAAKVGTNTASLGVDYADSSARWLYAEAGTPLNGGGGGWAAAGGGGWVGWDRGDLTLGVSLEGDLFGYGAVDSVSSGGGGTAEVMPTLTATRGALRTELATGLVGTADVSGGANGSRLLGESSARLIATAGQGVELGGEARYLRAADRGWPYLGATATVDRPGYAAWAFAGSWLASDLPTPRAALGAGGRVTWRRTSLEVELRQEPTDPLYLNLPRRTWTVRLARGFGRVPRAPAEPGPQLPPRILPSVANGVAVFRLPRAQYPQAPALVGDFSNWQPVAMVQDGEFWTARVSVDPGAHHYAFRAADGTVFLPPDVPSVDDGFGGRSGVLVVP